MTRVDTLTVDLSGSFSVEPVGELLTAWAEVLGASWTLQTASFGQVFQALLEASPTRDGGAVMHVVLLRASDWQGEASAHLSELFATATGRGLSLIVGLCRGAGQDLASWQMTVSDAQRLCGEASGASVLVEDDVRDAYPVDHFDDPSSDRIALMPFTRSGYAAWATALAREIHRRTRPLHKAIFVDCDNTLWRGVVGEVGPAGIELSDGHKAFQQMLVKQAEAGVVIGLCSKNSADDVERVWRERADMVLPRDLVTVTAVNWRAKSENLRELAQTLNLGLDSFLFIDDNAIECADVEANCPQVLVAQFPVDEAGMARFCAHYWGFDLRGDAAPSQRGEWYRTHLQREADRAAAPSMGEFLASLKLKVTFTDVTADLARAAELTLRTNQFHLSVRRCTVPELTAEMAAGAQGFLVAAADRFGDYGIVGFALCRAEAGALVVPSFMLSCRALGRGVEYEMLRRLGTLAQELDCAEVVLDYARTDRNQPALDFLHAISRADAISDIDGVRVPADRAREAAFDPGRQIEESVDRHGSADVIPADAHTVRRSAGLVKAVELSDVQAFLLEAAGSTGSIDGPQQGGGEGLGGEVSVGDGSADELETVISNAFAEALGKSVGRNDDFIESGGHSLVAVGIFARIMDHTGLELPISVLFEASTIQSLTQLVRARLAGDAAAAPTRFLVPMSPGQSVGRGPPLFLVGGRNGNVLTLARLARAFAERPVFGLQYRGVLGDDEPHESIEAAAADFLKEVRLVQDKGPYYLAGYSGGGLIALEMARMLREAGEAVGGIFMIDTRLPGRLLPRWASLVMRVRLALRDGRLGRVILRKLRLQGSDTASSEGEKLPAKLTPSQVRSIRIRAAFIASARAYQAPSIDVPLVLFRPADEPRLRVGPWTFVDFVGGSGVRVIDPGNGWGRYFAEVHVEQIPGNHNTMLDCSEAIAEIVRARWV